MTIENIPAKFDEYIEMINQDKKFSLDSNIFMYDLYLKNLLTSFFDQVPNISTSFFGTEVSKSEVTELLESRKKLFEIFIKINSGTKVELFEIQLIQNQLSNLGRQKLSIFDGEMGLSLLKIITKNTLENKSKIYDVKTFASFINLLSTNDGSVWKYIRDNISGYKARDTFFKDLTHSLANFSLFSDVSSVQQNIVDTFISKNEETEKSINRINKEDFAGSFTSSQTALDTVAIEYLSSIPNFTLPQKNHAKEAISIIVKNEYSENAKFRKNIEIIAGGIKSLEKGLRELRNSAGDAHPSTAIVDLSSATLSLEITKALIKFIKSKIK